MSIAPPIDGETTGQRRRFQFSVRTMFVSVAVAGGLFAVMAAVGPIWSVALGWFLLLAAAHVTANAQGTRRWRTGSREEGDVAERDATNIVARPAEPRFAPTTCLGHKRPLIRPLIAGAVTGISGAMIAAVLLTLLLLSRVGLFGVAVGSISAAVLCGLFGYLAASLLEVTMGAFGEARRGSEHGK